MRSFAKAHIFRRLTRLLVAPAVLWALVVWSPASLAHEGPHVVRAISFADALLPASGSVAEAIETAVVRVALSEREDGSCPSHSADGHADHAGCCGGIVSCVSGFSAAIVSDALDAFPCE
jgi:hypothetical protein